MSCRNTVYDYPRTSLIDEASDFSEEEAALLKRKLRQHGPNEFIKETITSGAYSAKSLLPLFGITPPEWFEGRDDDGYYRLLGMAIVRFLTLRQKLSEYNTIDDVVSLIRNSSKIMVITGAGVSFVRRSKSF